MSTNVIAKCGCGAVTVVTDIKAACVSDERLNRMWQMYRSVPCRECGRATQGHTITGKPGKRECGSWCTEGTGKSCTCQCGGKNHGATFQHTGALWYAS
jgi:hypothetical protein